MVKTYSKAANGSQKLSANFTVAEFACSDKSDKILIDENLVVLLQKIRTWAGAAIHINSGYRTIAYNAKIGGASASNHTKGLAADITVTGKTPQEVAKYAESIGAGGVGMYDGSSGHFVHVDTRAVRYFWVNKNGTNVTVLTHGGSVSKPTIAPPAPTPAVNPYPKPTTTLKKGSKGNNVKWIQWALNKKGSKLTVDGSFGTGTDTAVKTFQKKSGLTADGIVGPKTRDKLALA
ncbi:MAG: peptidoglycan-binding protein [Oscillospiraceae bacterium]|jgi:hypothetical protein|nr:peptidoglycan-binding protein [Oscillospiraceae bacterium]